MTTAPEGRKNVVGYDAIVTSYAPPGLGELGDYIPQAYAVGLLSCAPPGLDAGGPATLNPLPATNLIENCPPEPLDKPQDILYHTVTSEVMSRWRHKSFVEPSGLPKLFVYPWFVVSISSKSSAAVHVMPLAPSGSAVNGS